MKYLIFDMYGVIIEESKGTLTQFTKERFPDTDLSAARDLYLKASVGAITYEEFLLSLGFDNPRETLREHVENYLTLDSGFKPFAERFYENFKFALLSNDVLEWSEYFRAFHDIDKYFSVSVTSTDARSRKPDRGIYEYMINKLGCRAAECLFIDDRADNLYTARELGMKTILFDRNGEDYDGTVVNNFNELANWITQLP